MCVQMFLPVSCQKAKTGRTDFVAENHDVDVVAAAFGAGLALLHHPPLIGLVVRAVHLLQFDGHRPEERERVEVWPLRQV